MGRKAAPGFNPFARPAKFEPYNDPAIRSAIADAEVKAFQELMRRSREAGDHKDGDPKCSCGYCGHG
jgi:hypothetical protein